MTDPLVSHARQILERKIAAGTAAQADARIEWLLKHGQTVRAENVRAARIKVFGDPTMKIPDTQSPPPPDTNEMPAVPNDLLVRSEGGEVALSGEARTLVNAVLMTVRRDQREAMKVLALELRAITNDNSVLRQNLALLNTAMGDFQRLQVIPLRETLEHLRDEQGSVVIENARKLEQLIQALTNTVAAKGGLIPEDLKAQILDGRFENLEHRKEGEMVDVSNVQAMIEAAYARGRADERAHEENAKVPI